MVDRTVDVTVGEPQVAVVVTVTVEGWPVGPTTIEEVVVMVAVTVRVAPPAVAVRVTVAVEYAVEPTPFTVEVTVLVR